MCVNRGDSGGDRGPGVPERAGFPPEPDPRYVFFSLPFQNYHLLLYTVLLYTTCVYVYVWWCVSCCCVTFIGTLPSSLVQLRRLEGLYLFDNFIEGECTVYIYVLYSIDLCILYILYIYALCMYVCMYIVTAVLHNTTHSILLQLQLVNR